MQLFGKSELEKTAQAAEEKLKETEERLASREAELKSLNESILEQREQAESVKGALGLDKEKLHKQKQTHLQLLNELKLDKASRERRAKFDLLNELAAKQAILLDELYSELKSEPEATSVHSNFPIRRDYQAAPRSAMPKDIALHDAVQFAKNNLLFIHHSIGNKQVSLWSFEQGSHGDLIKNLLKEHS